MSTRIANTAASILNQTVLTAAQANAITGLQTFNRSPSAPFAVQAGSAVVPNLDADKVDGQHGAYYNNAANLTGVYTSPAFATSIVLNQAAGNYTVTWANPAAARAISFEDPGGTDILVYKAATQTLTNKTLGSLLSVTAFGTHSLSAGGAGRNFLKVENTTSGVANFADLGVVAGTTSFDIVTYSQGYTTSGINIASSTLVNSDGVGGLSLGATNGSGALRLYSGGTTETARFHASRGVSIGDTTDPGATNLRVAGTSTLVGNISVGGTNITDAVATPTIASGFGTSPSIVGKTFAFRITIGSGGVATSGVVNFGMTFANPPVVIVQGSNNGASQYASTVTTTQATIQFANTETELHVIVRGF